MNDRRFALLGIPALALLITLFTVPLPELAASAPRLLLNFLISLYFTAFLWLGNRVLWYWLLRRLPRVEQTSRRLWALAGASVVFTGVATALLRLPLHGLLPAYFPLYWPAQLTATLFNLIPTLIVQTLYEARYFFRQWAANVHRAEQLARAATQAQLDALQSQLDPHFLFNSLNTLAALIEPGNAPAQQFVEQLADVYRYVLLSHDRPTVPLAEELAFVETYLALHKAHFRANLQVALHVPPAALAHHVAPLSAQLLVENALKHNVASREQPLTLTLTADPAAGYLTVQNSRRPRPAGLTPGTGLGLRNVRHRYELLQAPRPVEVVTADGVFRVRLPLLPES